VAEGARLEIVCTERYRGFESLSLLNLKTAGGCVRSMREHRRPERRNAGETRQARKGATVTGQPGARDIISLYLSSADSALNLAMADVVYLVTDMLFSSKIRETAKPFGLTVQGTRDVAALTAAAAAGAKLVIVDLRLPVALDALGALAADTSASAVPSVGFIDHERTDVMDAARASGCGQVMAKGQFATALPKLLAALVSPSAV
jgi:hypothetical protein